EREVTGKKVKNLRQQDLIPAVLYGEGIKSVNLTVVKNDFVKLHNQVGTGSLIDLAINEKQPVKILIQDMQLDPRTDDIIHVDLYQIQEGKKITTSVELEFINEAPAVKELGGILVKNIDAIEIECLPKDLEKTENIKIDLSTLKTFNDIIHVGDIKLPEEIRIAQSLDEAVALVTQPKEEVVEEVTPVEAEGEGVEGEEGEEKPAEGEQKPGEAKEGEEKPAEEVKS
ncbi:50S ribosomal protein L25, partial [Patescibacteria group bacterium]